jgi:hypothetical protein
MVFVKSEGGVVFRPFFSPCYNSPLPPVCFFSLKPLFDYIVLYYAPSSLLSPLSLSVSLSLQYSFLNLPYPVFRLVSVYYV